MTLLPGLVSVTFRELSPPEIVALAAKAKLSLVEWGGDVHVPHGNVPEAYKIGRMTRDAGLQVAAYGSYYRVGQPERPAFETVLATAVALGAPLIRVWAGSHGSAQADESEWERILADSARICDLAADASIAVACEFHGGTLADTVPTTRRLLETVARPNLRTLWQPLGDASPAARRAEVEDLRPWLANVHVFHWPAGKRVPLADGQAEWQDVITALADSPHLHGLLLEFVKCNAPVQFLADAATLRAWLFRA